MVRSEHVRTLFNSTQLKESESEASEKEIYAVMHIKTHLYNALYQISAVCFEHEQELVIAELQLVYSQYTITFTLKTKTTFGIFSLQNPARPSYFSKYIIFNHPTGLQRARKCYP